MIDVLSSNSISEVIVRVLASSVVDHGFKTRSDQFQPLFYTNDHTVITFIRIFN